MLVATRRTQQFQAKLDTANQKVKEKGDELGVCLQQLQEAELAAADLLNSGKVCILLMTSQASAGP